MEVTGGPLRRDLFPLFPAVFNVKAVRVSICITELDISRSPQVRSENVLSNALPGDPKAGHPFAEVF